MKKFFVISLLAAIALPALACFFIETHNYYLFNVRDDNHLWATAGKETDKAWQKYIGNNDEYYYFDAEEVMEVAKRKGDLLMQSYVTNLKSYLKCSDDVASDQYSWNYPTKTQLVQRDKTLSQIRIYAQGKLNSAMKDQHALLFMRCNMLLRRHAENVQFFEKTASKYKYSPYQEMMRNIYAGALLKTGRTKDAVKIFADQGDWNSLMTQYYKKRSCQAIKQEYLSNPNSPALPFLVQDFVNNTQEAVDKDGFGKLFVRDISKAEAMQMIQLASQVLKEKKSNNPALWMSAKAWLEYMYGMREQAFNDARTAATLDDSDRIKDNARVIWLYIKSAMSVPDALFDDYLAKELEWLEDQSKTDYHYHNVTDRLVYQVLANKYTEVNRPETALAILRATEASSYNSYLDTMQVDHLLKYVDYAKTPAKNALEKFLKQHLSKDNDMMTDLIGTKYLRLCQWEKALTWLRQVPVSFYEEKGYACYAAKRKIDVEPWMRRQWLDTNDEWGDNKWHLGSNPKATFASEMQQMEQELKSLSGQARQQRCYDLAVRYAQAHYTGDCWFLMRDGKSIYDTLRVNETDLTAKARNLLKEASKSSDFKLREKSLYALSYYYLNNPAWYKEDWDSNYNMVRTVQRNTEHFKAFATLADFERANASRTSYYVSRCDEYKQFLKFYR